MCVSRGGNTVTEECKHEETETNNIVERVDGEYKRVGKMVTCTKCWKIVRMVYDDDKS